MERNGPCPCQITIVKLKKRLQNLLHMITNNEKKTQKNYPSVWDGMVPFGMNPAWKSQMSYLIYECYLKVTCMYVCMYLCMYVCKSTMVRQSYQLIPSRDRWPTECWLSYYLKYKF